MSHCSGRLRHLTLSAGESWVTRSRPRGHFTELNTRESSSGDRVYQVAHSAATSELTALGFQHTPGDRHSHSDSLIGE